MSPLLTSEVETLVNALLLAGDCVAEVSKELVVTRIWEKEISVSDVTLGVVGKKLSEIDRSHILSWCEGDVMLAIITGENAYREQPLVINDRTSFFSIRIINDHPGQDHVLVVTEQLNEAATARRSFYEHVLNHVAADIVVFDDQLRFLYLNEVAIKDDVVRAWLIGKTDADFCRLRNRPLSIAEKRMAHYRQAIEEKRIVEYEERSVTPSGEVLHHLRRIWPLFHENGELNVIVGYGLNVTESVVAREHLKELEGELRERNAELEASRLSLLNKVEQLEELSYIIAHNLRGPAGNIKTLAEGLLRKYRDSQPDAGANGHIDEEQGIAFIEESSDSLLATLDTLMQIAAIKLNKEIPHDDCDMPAIVNDIRNQLQSVIFEKQVVIRTEFEFDAVRYPRAYLENILYNLISNALKYTRKEVVPGITIKASRIDGRVVISVADNGLGINMQKYGDKIFKLNQVFHKGYDSKGVGLFITKTQVESLGGSIRVNSVENEGSEFIVTL